MKREAVIEDDELFGLIYTIDDCDDWADPANLIKANPNYGVSVSGDFLLSELKKPIRSPCNQARFKTKHYHEWKDNGALTVTDGNIIDFKVIREDFEDDHEIFPFEAVAYDPWGATQFAQELQDDLEINVVKFEQRTANLSEPMKWVAALLKDGRLHHDGNPVLT